ncbi:MAG: hypothetical protein RL527_958 [Planctomycetota bacterium]
MPDPLLAIAAGALVGAFVGLTGVGGGAIMTPILVLGFGIDPVVAIATDLLFASVVKIAAGTIHFRGQHVDMQVVRRLWLGSIPACIVVGSVLAIKVEPEQKLLVVRAMGALILVSGLSMLFGHLVQKLSTAKRLADPERFKKPQAALTVAAGVLLGSVIAATSIGAGAIGAVLLRALYPLRMTPIRLVATDTVFAIPVALVAGGSFAVQGRTDWSLLGLLLVGALPLAIVCSMIAARLDARWLKSIVGLTLLGIAIKMLMA